MNHFIVVLLSLLLIGCNDRDRFNSYYLLTENPTPIEVIGTYTLTSGDSAAVRLIEMGYDDIDLRIDINDDGTFSASRLPGCCIHGYDERSWTFTGGLYDLSGTWQIVKSDSVYEIQWNIEVISELTGLAIADKELARERAPPQSLNLGLVRGSPLDLGFAMYTGDFWYLPISRENPSNKTAEQGASPNH